MVPGSKRDVRVEGEMRLVNTVRKWPPGGGGSEKDMKLSWKRHDYMRRAQVTRENRITAYRKEELVMGGSRASARIYRRFEDRRIAG